MKNKLIELVTGALTGIVSWLLLSYVFFPIKLSASANEYFIATISHMVPLKSFITIIFVLVVMLVTDKILKKGKL
jgi:hypothetical protein